MKQASAVRLDRTVVLGAVGVREDALAVLLAFVPLSVVDCSVHEPDGRHTQLTTSGIGVLHGF